MGGRRKLTTRRFERRVRLNAARLEAWRQARSKPRPPGPLLSRPTGWQGWLGLVIAVLFYMVLVTWMLWNQVQVGRVLVAGVAAEGTVVAVSQCSRATAGNVTIVFVDATGEMHRVRHSSFTPGCFTTYHVDEVVAIRYVPSNPGMLMTQPELDHLWFSVPLFGLFDVIFLGGGGVIFVLVILPWAAGRVSALRAERSG